MGTTYEDQVLRQLEIAKAAAATASPSEAMRITAAVAGVYAAWDNATPVNLYWYMRPSAAVMGGPAEFCQYQATGTSIPNRHAMKSSCATWMAGLEAALAELSAALTEAGAHDAAEAADALAEQGVALAERGAELGPGEGDPSWWDLTPTWVKLVIVAGGVAAAGYVVKPWAQAIGALKAPAPAGEQACRDGWANCYADDWDWD